jgi:D-xylose transport system permease protein
MLTVKVFAMMGALCALSAIVASSRLTFHSNDIGTLDELRVIAAAVIGGTALSGGVGTIYGAILGALIMQSLQSGMAMVGVDAPYPEHRRRRGSGLAVFIDIIYRKRTGDKDMTAPRSSKCATCRSLRRHQGRRSRHHRPLSR